MPILILSELNTWLQFFVYWYDTVTFPPSHINMAIDTAIVLDLFMLPFIRETKGFVYSDS